MTSQASLIMNKKARPFRPALHAFRHAAAGGLAVAVLAAALFSLIVAGTFSQAADNARAAERTMRQVYQYFLLDRFAGIWWPALLTLLAGVQALLAFRFLYYKPAANAWYSLGLTRSELFRIRFMAGAAGTLLPVLAAMLAALALNIANFSNAGLVLSKWSLLTAGLLTQALALYAVAAVACVLAGTVVEALVHSAALVGLPTLLLVSVNALMVRFLFGNSIGAPEQYWSSFDPRLMIDLPGANPLLFLYRFLVRYASMAAGDDGSRPVSALPILGWLAAALVLIWLAHRLFRSRRAELTGVMNATPALTGITAFAAAFFAFSVPCMLPNNVVSGLPTGLLLLISCLAAAAVGLVVLLLLRMIGRRRWKGLLALPAGLAAMFAVVGVLASGCLGYSGYVPDAADVQSVAVSYNGVPAYVPKTNGWGGGSGFVTTVQFTELVRLADQNDIAAVTGLHKAYTGKGRLARSFDPSDPGKTVYNVWMKIVYTMKDGRTVTRLYQQADRELMMKMLSIDSLGGVRKAFADYISAPGESDMRQYGAPYQAGSVYLSSRFLDSTMPLTLDDAERQELLGCIAYDVANQSVDDRYFPARPEVCVLSFSTEFAMGQNGLPDWADRIYVTESFTKTIGFLNRRGLLASVAAAKEIDYLELQNFFHYRNVRLYLDNQYNLPLFMNGWGNADSLQYERGLMRVDDPAQTASILENCRSQYLGVDGGCIVYIHFKGDAIVSSAFLPIKDAPDFVTKGMNQTDGQQMR